MLQPSELALDRAAAAIQVTEPLALALDERVQSGRLDPDRTGLIFPGRAAPLGCLPLVVGSGKAAVAVNAVARKGLSAPPWSPKAGLAGCEVRTSACLRNPPDLRAFGAAAIDLPRAPDETGATAKQRDVLTLRARPQPARNSRAALAGGSRPVGPWR
jgi:hypothetical protein